MTTRLPDPSTRRLVVITGARQTGKTTLARATYPSLRYLNLDVIEEREALGQLRTRNWAQSVGPAVLDEAQKQPLVFEKVKFAYDEQQIDFSVLLGSSRILMLDKVKESLAGRAFLFDLWPLMPSELTSPADAKPSPPMLDRLITKPAGLAEHLSSVPVLLVGQAAEESRSAIDHLAQWGGMPELLRLDDGDRALWLRSYRQTFLERDLADLTRMADLLPFQKLQQLAMLRTGQLLSYAGLARDAQISAATARRYLEYLRISYQALLLQPFARNLTSATVKAPKLYWVDLGLLRRTTQRFGQLTGALFETLVVVEIHKWVQTMAREVGLWFYRTRSGMELDLVMETAGRLIGVEIKSRERVYPRDLKVLRAFALAAGTEWAGGLVVYRGEAIEQLDEKLRIWAVPVQRLLGG